MAVYAHLFFIFLFFFLTVTFASHWGQVVEGQCREDQKKLLLALKSELIFDSSESFCLQSWNHTGGNCCQWKCIECDEAGHIISLRLDREGITGGIGESSSLFRLTHLLELALSGNDLTTTHILTKIHLLTNLRLLDLSSAGLIGPIPSTLSSLTRLNRLLLSDNLFKASASFASTLSNLTELLYLDLQGNLLTGSIPSTLSNLTELVGLDLSFNSLTGSIPSTLSNLTHLLHLDLSYNSLTGSVPSFHMCNKLDTIDLSGNNLMGSLSHLHFQALTNLTLLDLSENSLNGTIPHHLFSLPSIQTLHLFHNQFGGQIKEFRILNGSKLEYLDLSRNRIQGPIPNSFFQLRSLYGLKLSNNLFDGTFQLQKIQSLPMLNDMRLSYNNLSVETTGHLAPPVNWYPSRLSVLHLSSCNMYDFPNLTMYSYLSDLDLSNNHIGGVIPSWIWETGNIRYLNLSLNLLTDLQKPYHIPPELSILDLHSNQLHCEFPLLPQFDWPAVFLLANNSLTGVIPTSICNASEQFMVLDLSFNNLSGSIPPCLVEENLVSSVFNLRGNNISGAIPDRFSSECGLKTFDVSNNNLGGKIPKSLANCEELVVMNVGNNNFDDAFPCMLPLSLQILVLRSNRFHGNMTCHKSWSNLQILDISSNNFSGTLNPLNLSAWKGMMLQSPIRPNRSASYILRANDYYQDEVTLTVKGLEMKLVKIWPDFTSFDLSCNNFEGDIPHAIGNLSSLYLLNLSHNAFTGTIPRSLGALTELGSLDLSANQLRGRIPGELTKLTFLSILNVSYNHLTGMIPNGPQFQTFSAYSFEGNTGLCGFPLEKSCSNTPRTDATPSESEDEEIEWEYVFATVGYVVGIGSIAWTFLCCRSFRERYFENIEDVADKIFYEPGRRRRHARRVEMRNEVLRRRRQRS